MKIDNQKTMYRIWISRLTSSVIFTALVVVVIFLEVLEKDNSPVSKAELIILLSLIFIIYSLLGFMRNPYYFYFDDNNDVLVFRYYAIAFFNSKKNSVEIPKQHFVKFETSKFFFGRYEKLVLYQFYRNKIAKYPSISLSAISKSEREKLKLALDGYSMKKKN